MLSREFQHLDAVEIGRNRDLWRPILRAQALIESRAHTVAIIHRGPGRDAVTLFQPSNRFYRADGPYLYDGLRYFLYIGPGAGADHRLKKSLGMPSKPPEGELEPLEFEDQATGEFRSLGSPTAKVPKSPTLPKVPGLPSIPEVPSIPKAPSLPGLPQIPGIPELPEFDIVISTDPLIPIEFRVVDGKGNPIPPTPFKVTLPDGTVKQGMSDEAGFIRVPDNRQKGVAKLELLDPAETDPAKIAAFAPAAKASDKRPIEIELADEKGGAIAFAPFRLKLPDGSVKQGKSDAKGFIRIPDNEQTGDMELVLTDFETAGA